jgi:hypothetical protein
LAVEVPELEAIEPLWPATEDVPIADAALPTKNAPTFPPIHANDTDL